MTRPLVIVGMAALGLALGGCTTGPGGAPAGSGATPHRVLKMINNTAGTVTMQSCPAGESQHCSKTARIAAGDSADFPLTPLPPGRPPRLLWITGYGSQPVCFFVPAARGLRSATARVTDAQTDDCGSLYVTP